MVDEDAKAKAEKLAAAKKKVICPSLETEVLPKYTLVDMYSPPVCPDKKAKRKRKEARGG